MRRFAVLCLLVCLGLSACNMPSVSESSTATPAPALVATSVSATLTAMPLPPTQPPQPFATVTAVLPSPTAAPSLTPAGPTPTAIATLTVAPDDPAAALGDPAFRNAMDTGRGFGLAEPYEDDNVRIVVENGFLTMSARRANGWHSWRLTSPKIGDVYLEVTARTRDCFESDTYGLVARAPDFESGKGYYFGVTCDGRYTLGKWVESGIVDVIDYTQNAAILSGPNQTNRLGMRMQGDRLMLYANGKLLQEITDPSFVDSGYYGVFLAPNKTASFAVDFDQIAYWNLR